MRRLTALLALAVLPVLLLPRPAAADPAPDVTVQPAVSRIGDHLRLVIRLVLRPGERPELTPGTDGWAGIELVSLQPPRELDTGPGGVTWLLEATVAPFALGDLAFSPTIAVISGSDLRTIEPAPVLVAVLPTLPADAPLELSPLAPPVPIAGAESPLLRPALAAAAAAGALLLAAAGTLLIRRLRARRPIPQPAPPPSPEPTFEALLFVEQTIETDPVAAYRALAAAVRAELARRFGIPATALTAAELRARLEADGADRWAARLAGGLLEECDAVVYAGYRPASARRQADLALAYELVAQG